MTNTWVKITDQFFSWTPVYLFCGKDRTTTFCLMPISPQRGPPPVVDANKGGETPVKNVCSKFFTATNTPKRVRQTLFNKARCLNTDSGFRQTFGVRLMLTVAYLRNRVPHSILQETYPTSRSSGPGPSVISRIQHSWPFPGYIVRLLSIDWVISCKMASNRLGRFVTAWEVKRSSYFILKVQLLSWLAL